MMPPAPMPCKALEAARNSSVGDTAQASDPTIKTISPIKKTRLGLQTSPKAARGSSTATTANWYALTTQTEAAASTFRSALIAGKAVLAIAVSKEPKATETMMASRAGTALATA